MNSQDGPAPPSHPGLLTWSTGLGGGVYDFPVAGVTNYHTLRLKTKQIYYMNGSGGEKPEVGL